MLTKRSSDSSDSQPKCHGLKPKNRSTSKDPTTQKPSKLLDRFKKQTVNKPSLKQNRSDLDCSDSERKHPLSRKTVRFLGDSSQNSYLTQSNKKANVVSRMSSYCIDVTQLKIRKSPKLQLIAEKLDRLWRRRVSLGFQKIKQILLFCETSESEIPVRMSNVYNYDALPGLLDACSNLYKLRYQKIMVEAFSKISFEFKDEQAKYLNLERHINQKRVNQLLNPLGTRCKRNQLRIMLKGFAFQRMIDNIRNFKFKASMSMRQKFTTRTFTQNSGQSSRVTSSNKISRLLANIKREKDQPSERIYINQNYHAKSKNSEDHVASVVDQLTDRVQRLEEMLAESQSHSSVKKISCPISENKPPGTDRKFRAGHMGTKSELISDKSLPNLMMSYKSSASRLCLKCQLAYCICLQTQTKDHQTQTNLNSTMPIPTKALFRQDSREKQNRVNSIPKKVITLIPKRELELVYVQETVFRPVLVEKIPKCTVYQTIVPVKEVPRMTPDIVNSDRSFQKREVATSQQRKSRFLKVTVKK